LQGKFVLRAENLLVFLPAVQMLLAVRLVLCLRVYLWAPHSDKAAESILFSLIAVPLLIFFGCYAFGLNRLGRSLSEGVSFFYQDIKRFPPVIFLLVSLAVYAVLFLMLNRANNFEAVDGVFAFQNFEWSYYALLAAVPLGFLVIGFLIDQYYRSSGSNEIAYQESFDDPITYALTRREQQDAPSGNSTSSAAQKGVNFIAYAVLAAGIAVAFKYGVSGRWSQLLGGAGTLLSGLAALWLYHRGKQLAKYSQTRLAFLKAIKFICFAVTGVIVLRTILPPLNAYDGISAASLAKGINVRTNTVFEILILILTMRILRAFFVSWRNIDEKFGLRGTADMALLFVAPALMLFISFSVSRDLGAAFVHLPALIGLMLLVTGSWAVWKHASGRVFAVYSLIFPFVVIFFYLLLIFSTTALSFMDPHDSRAHRYILLQGQESALDKSHIGGKSLLEAIEQQWRMTNYAAAGGSFGWKGYGQSPIPEGRAFRDITLDDIVFDIYVLSEHGAFGGLALLSLYGLIFFLMLKLAWDSFRESRSEGRELRFALAGGLALMIFFPAIYMAGANVNSVLFTGQNLPLLNLRSYTEILRTGVVLMLFAAVLKPLSPKRKSSRKDELPSAWEILKQVPALLITLFGKGQRAKSNTLSKLGYKDPKRPWTAGTVILTNICLIAFLLICFVVYAPVRGILHASNNKDYLQDLNYASLKKNAVEQIAKGNIWFEPLAEGQSEPGECRGGDNKNKAAPADANPFTAYQLCIDKSVAGGAEKDTLNVLIKEWNSPRRRQRGNDISLGIWHDGGLFFQLNTNNLAQQSYSIEKKLAVNQSSFNIASPFRPPRGWLGNLTEAAALDSDGGVLVGSGVVLPLAAVPYEDKKSSVYVGAMNPGPVRVNLNDSSIAYPAGRGFSIAENENENPIFEISTVKGAEGAVLRSGTGDFNLYINGSPLLVSESTGGQGERGTAPTVRLDDGDVIAYAKREG
ncbi:MAG TPA: hypothetical protein VF721_05585, partial [Pyrinomonadaceae bacterium]